VDTINDAYFPQLGRDNVFPVGNGKKAPVSEWTALGNSRIDRDPIGANGDHRSCRYIKLHASSKVADGAVVSSTSKDVQNA
jgi:hypothetical protein